MVGHGGSRAGSYLADPTSPIPSHCASIVVTSTVRVNSFSQIILLASISDFPHPSLFTVLHVSFSKDSTIHSFYAGGSKCVTDMPYRKVVSVSPWYNIGQRYQWEGPPGPHTIGRPEIPRFQIQPTAIPNFQRKCPSEHLSKTADTRQKKHQRKTDDLPPHHP